MNEGFYRGMNDWISGIHECPYSSDDYRSFDWRLGQERAARCAQS